jgi:hypothetical protein
MLSKPSERINPLSFFPSANHLEMWQRAVHEYLGLAWSKSRGRI